MILETIERLSEDTLEELFQSWKCNNKESLIKRVSSLQNISTRFFNMSADSRKIIYFIITSDSKDILAADLAYKIGYTQKQLSSFFAILDEVIASGFVYLRKKRMRLNSNDDSIYIIPIIKDILNKLIFDGENIEFTDKSYNKDIYSKHENIILSLYKETSFVNTTNYSNTLSKEEIIELVKANIILISFKYSDEEKKINSFIRLNNIKLINKIKKDFEKKIDQSEGLYNHSNIISDIYYFLYAVDSEKLKVDTTKDYIDLSLFDKQNLSNDIIFQICFNLGIIDIDFKLGIVLNHDNIYTFSNKTLKERKRILHTAVFFKYGDYISDVLDIVNLDENQEPITSRDVFTLLRNTNGDYSLNKFENALKVIFILGLAKVYFYKNEIISISKVCKKQSSRCIINGNFELTLINHESFDDEFIYICSLYFNLEKNGNVYLFKITEDSILRGKTLTIDSNIYTFQKLMEMLDNVLKENNLIMPTHLEISINRWYEKSINANVYTNVTLICIKDEYKLQEIIHDAKRKGINIKSIDGAYAIVTSNVSRYSLVKFLRQKKIIVSSKGE